MRIDTPYVGSARIARQRVVPEIRDPFGHVPGHVQQTLGRRSLRIASDGCRERKAIACIGAVRGQSAVIGAAWVVLEAPWKRPPIGTARAAFPFGFGWQAPAREHTELL